MTEGNTVYRGGKDGVSGVLASALWSADYLLRLMSLGYAGVNLHGGSGHAQAVSVGGVFHGEALMKDPTAPHPKPFYTPIANEGTLAGAGVNGKLNSTYLLEPVGYGMRFAAAFGGTTMLPVTFDAGLVNASAFAAKRADGHTLVTLLNEDPDRTLKVSLGGCSLIAELTGAALDSREAVFRQFPSPAARTATKISVPPHTGYLLLLA